MVIAITNQKGGVGKTTTAINLSASLALLDYRVLVVDMDPQGNSSDGLGINTNKLDNTVYDALVNETPLSDIIIPLQTKNLFVAPTNITLSGAETELASDISRPFKLRKAIKPELAKYDFIIVDCPPSLSILTVNAIVASTDLLVPIEPNGYALKGMSMLMSTILKVREDLEHYARFLGVVVNMFDQTLPLHVSILEAIREYFTPRKVFRTTIPRSPRIPEAEIHGQPVHQYAPEDIGARQFSALAQELIEKTHDRKS